MVSTSQYNAQSGSGELKSRASHIIEEDIIEPAQRYLSRARDLGSKTLDRGSEIVKENPGYSMLGAAALGFLIGAYVARQR